MIKINELAQIIKERSGDFLFFIEKISNKSGFSTKEILYGILGIETLSIDVANLISDELNLNISEFGNIFFNQ